MIEEAYVSFETAKLLKEKGFDAFTFAYYSKDDEDSEPVFGMESLCSDNWNGQPDEVNDLWWSAPTQQMAMCWLREVYNQHIVIQAYNNVALLKTDYYVEIQNLNEPTKKGYCVNGCMRKSTYEEAVESAIKYCLTNLIK